MWAVIKFLLQDIEQTRCEQLLNLHPYFYIILESHLYLNYNFRSSDIKLLNITME